MSLPILLTKLRKDLEGVFTSLEIAKWWFLKIIWWFHNIMHRSLNFLEMMINKMTMHTTFYFIWKPICWKREILSLFLKYTQTTFWSQSIIRDSISKIIRSITCYPNFWWFHKIWWNHWNKMAYSSSNGPFWSNNLMIPSECKISRWSV